MGLHRTSHPRFRRAGQAPRIELTDDDVAILRHLHRHRFVRTTDLYRLLGHRSSDKISRRLTRLYRARFVDRPLSQIDSFRGSGSQPLVYGLDDAGARYLAEQANLAVNGTDWARRNRRYTRENLDHTLAVTRFMIDLELACRAREDVEFIPFENIGDSTARKWSVVLPWHGSQADITVAPDAIFGLRLRVSREKWLRSFYFLEIDRGTMTITPSESARRSDGFLYRSSILRKLLAYAVSHLDNMHQDRLAIPAARVLMVTTKASRSEAMRKAANRLVVSPLNVPMGLFLFVADTDIDPLTMPFQEASGATVRLADDRVSN